VFIAEEEIKTGGKMGVIELEKVKAPLYNGKKVSFDEYLKLKEDGFQYEIIEGVMRVTPAPFSRHQRLILKISYFIEGYLEKNPKGILYIAPRDVKFSKNNTYQPDILYISKERLNINKEEYVDGSPDFIIEILSKGTLSHDTRLKFYDYEKYGVREYWIFDPYNISFSEFYFLQNGKYEQFEPEDNILKSKVIEGFEIDLIQLEKSLDPFKEVGK